MPVFGTTFAAKIKCHSKTLDRLKEKKIGVVVVVGGGGHDRLSVPFSNLKLIKPQQKK